MFSLFRVVGQVIEKKHSPAREAYKESYSIQVGQVGALWTFKVSPEQFAACPEAGPGQLVEVQGNITVKADAKTSRSGAYPVQVYDLIPTKVGPYTDGKAARAAAAAQ